MTLPRNVKNGLILFFSSAVLAIPAFFFQAYYAPADFSRMVAASTSAVLLLLLLGLGYKMMCGRNWARILNAVLAVGAFIPDFGDMKTVYHHPIVGYLYWAQTILLVLSVVFLFTPSSNVWFRLQKKETVA